MDRALFMTQNYLADIFGDSPGCRTGGSYQLVLKPLAKVEFGS